METLPILNAHNKAEHEPSHSCEHILNGTMVKMFGCPWTSEHLDHRTVQDVFAAVRRLVLCFVVGVQYR